MTANAALMGISVLVLLLALGKGISGAGTLQTLDTLTAQQESDLVLHHNNVRRAVTSANNIECLVMYLQCTHHHLLL